MQWFEVLVLMDGWQAGRSNCKLQWCDYENEYCLQNKNNLWQLFEIALVHIMNYMGLSMGWIKQKKAYHGMNKQGSRWS